MQIPAAYSELFHPKRYKVYYGGRGGAKSWAFADALLMLAGQKRLRILCARELQVSIADSVHKLLADQIRYYGLENFYQVQKTTIIGKNGSEFLFKGLKHNIAEIKSTESIDICWVEEAEKVSSESWEVLIPTIRKEGSEIWISFNPKNPTDATWERFVANKHEDSIVKKVSWRDNPFFPEVLDKERRHMERIDPEAYAHIWEGEFDTRYFGGVYAKQIADAQLAGRIHNLPYDSALPVHTAWDLGYDDSTAIWFWQIAHNEVRLIDYYEASGEDIEHYCRLIKSKPYKYGNHYAPHDAANKLLAAGGRSIVQQAHGFGVTMQVVAATSQQNSIEAARKTLQVSWFDAEKCKEGIKALQQYQFEYDEDKKTFRSKPRHDWASHGSDAYEIIGQVWQEIKRPRPPAPINTRQPTFDELHKQYEREEAQRKDYY